MLAALKERQLERAAEAEACAQLYVGAERSGGWPTKRYPTSVTGRGFLKTNEQRKAVDRSGGGPGRSGRSDLVTGEQQGLNREADLRSETASNISAAK
jgi:hypothetical protein